MNLIIFSLLSLAISEFIINNRQFEKINETFNMVDKSFQLISEVQRVAFNVRMLIFINEEVVEDYSNYTSEPDFPNFLTLDTQEALDSIYSLQSNISMSDLNLFEEH
mmetsp:Transcript_29893/g.29056  ORF Transcript_29893/g.29056 Transcript_29893/m.29056 type:complete len:107 (+) Transcript_29893:501-821(+)